MRPRAGGGYALETRPSFGGGKRSVLTADRVVLAGGVMGTLPLLLEMQADREGLPRIFVSPRRAGPYQ